MSVTAAEKYADVLYEWAEERDAVQEAEESLNRMEQFIEQSEDFRLIWLHPVLPASTKKKILEPVLDDQISPGMWGFISLIMERRREKLLPAIAGELRERILRARGVEPVDVYAADDIPEDLREQLNRVLSERESTEVILRYHQNPELLGGLVVRIGDLKIDGSLRNRLRKLRRVLSAGTDVQMPTRRDE